MRKRRWINFSVWRFNRNSCWLKSLKNLKWIGKSSTKISLLIYLNIWFILVNSVTRTPVVSHRNAAQESQLLLDHHLAAPPTAPTSSNRSWACSENLWPSFTQFWTCKETFLFSPSFWDRVHKFFALFGSHLSRGDSMKVASADMLVIFLSLLQLKKKKHDKKNICLSFLIALKKHYRNKSKTCARGKTFSFFAPFSTGINRTWVFSKRNFASKWK